MKICCISYTDFSNFAYNIARGITLAGIQCDSYSILGHRFGYEEQSTRINPESVKDITSQYDIVMLMHSNHYIYNLVDQTKKLIVCHTGTPYRQAKEAMNAFWNDKVEKCFYDSSEFHNTGMKNESYIFGCIDVSKYQQNYVKGRPFQFAHFPSDEKTKGTETILRIAEKTGINLLYSNRKVSHEEQLARMSICDIYIELFAPKQGDQVYGSFGITALEAAAMGKIVITNNEGDVYRKTYGDYNLQVMETEEELENCLDILNKETTERIRDFQEGSLAWVKRKHDLLPTGLRILQELRDII